MTSKRFQKGAETEHLEELANSGPAYQDSLQNSRVSNTGHIAQSPSHSLSHPSDLASQQLQLAGSTAVRASVIFYSEA